jgi:hypothetical protein
MSAIGCILQIMLIGESLARNIVTITTAGAMGFSALMGGMNACGGGGEERAPAPVDTGGEVREGNANSCELTIARDGANFVGRAVVNGTIPGGSELVYTARYQATWEDGPYSTSETRIPAEGTMSASGVIKVNDKDRKFFGFSGKIDLAGKNINLACSSATLDDLPG